MRGAAPKDKSPSTWYDMHKRFVLDPNLSAMENLWNGCQKACYVILAKKRLRLTSEEREELIVAFTASAVASFMANKIRNHGYCHDVDFYANCYSCALSVSGDHRVIDRYLNDIKRRLNTTSMSLQVGMDEEATVEALLEDTGRHPLEHDGLFPYNLAPARRRNESQEDALRRVWQDQDMEAEASGLAVDHNEVELHRKAILNRLKDKYPKAEYMRKWRAKKRETDPEWHEQTKARQRKYYRAKAQARQAEELTSAAPHPCPDTRGNAVPPVQQDQT